MGFERVLGFDKAFWVFSRLFYVLRSVSACFDSSRARERLQKRSLKRSFFWKGFGEVLMEQFGESYFCISKALGRIDGASWGL